MFASSQTSNQAIIFNDLLYHHFKPDSIDLFITEMKNSLKKIIDLGMDLPNNILSYLILFKFPSCLQSLPQKIMHSNKDVTVNLVLNHLTQLDN